MFEEYVRVLSKIIFYLIQDSRMAASIKASAWRLDEDRAPDGEASGQLGPALGAVWADGQALLACYRALTVWSSQKVCFYVAYTRP